MRIGVFGGTFDPVHNGHIRLAEAAATAASLDRVLFMPAHIQPFKLDARLASDADRENMLRLAFGADETFAVTDVETSRGGVSYTIDSLTSLRDGYGGYADRSDAPAGDARGQSAGGAAAEWFFIVGADMFLSLGKWHGCDRLMSGFGCVVGRRPGNTDGELEAAAARYRDEYGMKTVFADTWVDISSTDIRRRLSSGESVSGLTPDAVTDYIKERGLYGCG
jgi:nicotinate-nucleotide adenylyltransferase